jgi:hypothetical protein
MDGILPDVGVNMQTDVAFLRQGIIGGEGDEQPVPDPADINYDMIERLVGKVSGE